MSLLNSSTSLGQIGGIDALLDAAAPIFVASPETLGQGHLDMSLLGQTALLDSELAGPGALLIARQDQEFAAKIGYQLRLRFAAAALAVHYGLTDHLDVSLLFLVVHAALAIDVTRQIVKRRVGSTFEPITSPVVRSHDALNTTGFGDLTLGLKYQLPTLGPIHLAAVTEVQFPTGQVAQLTGTGDYWITPTLDAQTKFGHRASATLNVGFDFDISDSIKSQALYALGVSYMLIPRRLIGVVEFLGRSDLDARLNPKATDALYLFPDGHVQASPLFGLDFGRHDYFDLSFGIRVVLATGIIGFVSGIYQLNDVGLHGGRIIPTIGLGAAF